ncbi:MAG: four-carbon acid sugar kinase family protein [Spirochaetia bacterium]
MNTRIAIAADDNTGATDAAGMLTSFGAKALLILDPSLLEELQCENKRPVEKESPVEYDVVVLSTRIRSIPPDEAYDLTYRVLKALGDWGFDILQLKYCSTFDSTPEGNIGKSLDAAQDLLGFSSTIVCPALPVNGRTTYMGYHFVHGLLLSESPLSRHPLNPMTDSNLLRWLGYQTRRGIGLIRLDTIRSGAEAISKTRRKLEDEGAAYHVCDAIEQKDIDLTVEAYSDKTLPDGGPTFLSGGSGVSLSLGNLYYSDLPSLDYTRELQKLSPVLAVISGSESPTAQSQRAYAKAHGFIEITVNPLDILAEYARTTQETQGKSAALGKKEKGWEDSEMIVHTTERIASACKEGKSVVTALERKNGGSVEEVNEEARRKGLGPVETGELIATFLGKIAARLVHNNFIERLLVAGGETSGAVCRECGFKALEVGLPIDPGVPYCFPVDFSSLRQETPRNSETPASSSHRRTPLVILKSGNFGEEDLYPRAARLGSKTVKEDNSKG